MSTCLNFQNYTTSTCPIFYEYQSLVVVVCRTSLLGRKLVDYEMIQDIPTATKQIKNLFYDYLHNYAE